MKKFLIVVAIVIASLGIVSSVVGAQAGQFTCEDVDNQVDIANSVFPADFDPTNLDANDDGLGCEANNPPPTAYDFTGDMPTVVTTTTTAPPVTTTTTTAPPAQPAEPQDADPDFTG